jgi:hypothetical protein
VSEQSLEVDLQASTSLVVVAVVVAVVVVVVAHFRLLQLRGGRIGGKIVCEKYCQHKRRT